MKNVSLLLALAVVCLGLLAANCEANDPFKTENEVEDFADELKQQASRRYCLEEYRRCRKGKPFNPLLPSNPVLQQNNIIGSITARQNYRLSFDIIPRGIVSDWGSIVHFSKGGNCCEFGQRTPGIWFHPGSTKLHIIIGDANSGNWPWPNEFYSAAGPLPLNVRTRVVVECRGSNVKVIVGGQVFTAVQPTSRYAGPVTVYASDPWYLAANAEVYNLRYRPIRLDDVTSQDEGEGLAEQDIGGQGDEWKPL